MWILQALKDALFCPEKWQMNRAAKIPRDTKLWRQFVCKVSSKVWRTVDILIKPQKCELESSGNILALVSCERQLWRFHDNQIFYRHVFHNSHFCGLINIIYLVYGEFSLTLATIYYIRLSNLSKIFILNCWNPRWRTRKPTICDI